MKIKNMHVDEIEEAIIEKMRALDIAYNFHHNRKEFKQVSDAFTTVIDIRKDHIGIKTKLNHRSKWNERKTYKTLGYALKEIENRAQFMI